jgi:hypothetical protein
MEINAYPQDPRTQCRLGRPPLPGHTLAAPRSLPPRLGNIGKPYNFCHSEAHTDAEHDHDPELSQASEDALNNRHL